MHFQEIKSKASDLSQNFKNFWQRHFNKETYKKDDQQHVMTTEEKLDQSLEESFPASDSPAHFFLNGITN